MQKWKKLSSRVILDHPRMKVVEDKVELPNGLITDYVKIESSGCSAEIICRNETGKILIQQEYSYPPDEILFQFPGGHVPEGEDAKVGANRELMEESGYKANKLQLLGTYIHSNRRSNLRAYVFLATDLVEQTSDKGDPEENIESFWLTEEEIDKKIAQGEITNLHTLGAWMLYKASKL